MNNLKLNKNNMSLSNKSSWLNYKYVVFLLVTFFSTIIVAFLFSYYVLIKFNAINIFLSVSEIENVRGLNFLIFGIDETQNTHRSDAILVAHLDQQKNRIGLISIPRDTRVKVKGHGRTRINHAFSYGGASLLTATVSDFLDIPIDHYIQINLNGVEKFIDILGGVEIDVKKELVYVDYAGDLYINVKKGKQIMKGKKAIEYLRFRQDDEGDIGRIRRQQYFINALVKEVASFDNVFKFPKLIKSLNDLIKTDIGLKQLTSFAFYFKNAIKESSISKATVPGRVSLIGGAYYWKPNSKKLDKVIDKVLYENDFDEFKLANTKQINTLQNKPLKTESLDSIGAYNTNIVKTESLDKFASSDLELSKVVEKKKVLDSLSSNFSEQNNVEEKKLSEIQNQDNLAKEVLEFDTEISNTTSISKTLTLNNLVNDKKTLDVLENKNLTNEAQYSQLDSNQHITTQNNLKIAHNDNEKKLRRYLSSKEVKRFANVNGEFVMSDFEGLKCEILNGVGVNGVAKGAAKILKNFGISVPRFANAGHFNYEKTIIVDWHGSVSKSLELAMLLEIDPNNIIVYDNQSKPLNFTLVIGKDWFEKKEILDKINDT